MCQCRKDIDLMRLQLRQCIGETVRLYIPEMQTGILADKIENIRSDAGNGLCILIVKFNRCFGGSQVTVISGAVER